ncbi:unnamed protein product [Soboliphyme baturini]|uniref:Secreted protein n=1 Tax=Soboliphyme baturini TaxID=241478 RepID=A0A183IS21_9BILA|nr:unnamed protein product [Soboliphyme baturini]
MRHLFCTRLPFVLHRSIAPRFSSTNRAPAGFVVAPQSERRRPSIRRRENGCEEFVRCSSTIGLKMLNMTVVEATSSS